MKCKSCNNNIPSGDQFCRKCGRPSPLTEQKNKIATSRQRLVSLPRERAHSPLFIIIAIVFTLMSIGRAVGLLYGDFTAPIEGAFMIIAAVGMWLCYCAKDNDKMAKELRAASIYDAYVRVVLTIWIVILSTVFVGFSILCFVSAYLLAINRAVDVDEALPMTLVTIGIAALVFGGILILVITFVRSVFASRRAYYLELAKLSEGEAYTEKRSPATGSLVFGIAAVTFGVTDFSFSVFLTGIATQIFYGLIDFFGLSDRFGIDISEITGSTEVSDLLDLILSLWFGIDGFNSLGELDIFGWIIDLFGAYVNQFTSILSLLLAAIGTSSFVIGIYFILTGVWVSSVHERAKSLREELSCEIVARVELEREIREEENEAKDLEAVAKNMEHSSSVEDPTALSIEHTVNDSSQTDHSDTPLEHSASEENECNQVSALEKQ